MRNLVVMMLAVLAAETMTAPQSAVVALSPQDAAQWEQWLCPLPKEVTLTGRVTVPVTALRVQLGQEPTDLDRSMLQELADDLESRTGVAPDLTGPVEPASMLLDFSRRPTDADLLGSKRNADQSYCLESVTAEGRVSLACRALTDRGSYLGMKTLKQLLLATVQNPGPDATVDVPVGRIVDWPDLAERGQWGGTAARDLEWLTDLKFNLLEFHATLSVDRNGVGHAQVNAEVLDQCRRRGVRLVPIIHHLEQLVNVGLFEAYPMIEAQGAGLGNENQRVICFARPEVVKPLSDWLTDLGGVPDVTEVMIWLSEEGKGCQCEQCREADRFVQEVEACVKALRIAQQTRPGLGLRVLLTQGSYQSNDKVLAALPPDVRVSYYHGGLTYNTERKPMIYPLLEGYLAQGRWLGVYPTLSSNWLTVAPFSNPEFTHYRLTEFVDKGLSNIVAYIVPTALYYQVNTEGGLEWAWNAHGRTPAQFAHSYAVRHGLRDPRAFVRWTETLGPVAWDLYDSRFPYYEHWGNPTIRIAAGQIRAELGGPYFAAYKTAEHFRQNLQQCDEALRLAESLGDVQFIAETRIIRGYTQLLQAVYQLNQLVHGAEGVRPQDREAAGRWFAAAQEGIQALSDNYPVWGQACRGDGAGEAPPERYTSTLLMMERLGARIGELMEQCGFVDEQKPYRPHVIGTWHTEEFASENWQTRRLDVTGLVDGPGTYMFRPVYKSGSLGLIASRAALVSFPRERPEDLRQEAVDEHRCHAGAWVEGDIYTLELRDYDPARGYAVMAHIGGGNSTVGEFVFRKLRR